MDAAANVWVGIRSEDCDMDQLVEQLPKSMFDKDGDDLWSKAEIDRSIAEHGCYFNYIWCCGGTSGLGVRVFHHNWECGVKTFNVEEVAAAISNATEKVKALFKSCGLDESLIGVWCHTNYN